MNFKNATLPDICGTVVCLCDYPILGYVYHMYIGCMFLGWGRSGIGKMFSYDENKNLSMLMFDHDDKYKVR